MARSTKKAPAEPEPSRERGYVRLYAAYAVSPCRLTSDSAIWLSVLSVFFSCFNVASSSFTASLSPSSFAQVFSVP